VSTDTETGQHRRRRVTLTPVRSIPVDFTGQREGDGPLTLGQLNMLQWINQTAGQFFGILCVELPVPDGVSVDDVAETIAVLVTRHESLRTDYVGGEQPRQRVTATGVLMLDVCSLGDGRWGPRDRPAVAGALVRWLRSSLGRARPTMRVVLATAPGDDGRVVACAAGFSHLAVDHGAIEIVKREFAEMVGDPALRHVGEPRHQPLDQAELEATPAERRRAASALRYLREQLHRVPPCLYPMPADRAGGEPLAVELSSVAAAMAVRRAAARTRSSRSSIVLAAVCAVLAYRTGYRELVFPLLSSNRFERHLTNYVGSLAQGCIATVDITDASFDALVKNTWTSVMEASRHARYDTTERVAMDQRTEYERGLRLNYEPLFNNRVAESWSGFNAHVGYRPEQINAALGQTELRWRPVHRNGTPVRFGLIQIDRRLLLDMWTTDTGFVPRAEMESSLLAIERLLVAAAHDDLDAGRIHELIGMKPIARTRNWMLIDSCWVDLTEVQHLLERALAPTVARIFPPAAGRPLAAYLAATDSLHTPEQAHNRCMAALPHHPTALTPRHYVICPTAPPNPTDLAAWPPPLTTGTGRTPPIEPGM
jgi:hypothetical protein